MKKIVLIAASFLLNTACVKYDCFAMNNRFDMASEHSSSSGQSGNRQHTVNSAEEEQKKMFYEMLDELEKRPDAILRQCPKIGNEFMSTSRAASIITLVKASGFKDYQKTLFLYTVAMCTSFTYESAYEKAKEELVAIKNENQRQKARIEELEQNLQKVLDIGNKMYDNCCTYNERCEMYERENKGTK